MLQHEPIIITSDDDLIHLDLPGSGTEEDPYVISNLYIKGNYQVGISITNTTKYLLIINCSIDVMTQAIECINVAPNTVAIKNNTIINAELGILLFHTNSTHITGNNLDGFTNVGIFVCSSSNLTLENNDIRNCSNGIELMYSSNIDIKNNAIYHNDYGVVVSYTSLVNITLNLFQKNSNYAIRLDNHANDNIIYYNDFIENNIEKPSQAYDDGYNNTWYNLISYEGNYWSNWVGINVYPIAGSANAVDNHPLNKPVHEWLNVKTFGSSWCFAFIGLSLTVYTIIKTRKKKLFTVTKQ